MDAVAELQKILICCDLDRTLIPNGFQEESTPARPVFRRIAEHSNIHLAYVSGRDRKLILDAIEEFSLPLPDYAIADVGTALYRVDGGNWQLSDNWYHEIAQDWSGLDRRVLAQPLENIAELQLQEQEKQSRYKLSFYTAQDVDHRHLIEKIRAILSEKGAHSNIIWSVDEISARGLLDIIPARASKLYAIKFLMRRERFAGDRTVFAGDSGNDLDVLTSGMQAILVRNAMARVRKEAIETLSGKGIKNCLYIPKGSFYGMNGNYAAGVIEGLVHFIPETAELIAEALDKSRRPTAKAEISGFKESRMPEVK
jgi:HAD superfamily hydrolase (TIGR01484 family)